MNALNSDNSTSDPPDNDEEPKWNGVSIELESLNNTAIGSPASLDNQQTEDRRFCPESSLESFQLFVDAVACRRSQYFPYFLQLNP